MNEPDSTFINTPVSEKSFPWGCLLGGCLSVILIVLVGAGISIYAGYRLVRSQIEQYTSDRPTEIPVVEYSDEQIAEAKKRFEDLRLVIEQGGTPEEVVLTADDINAMISGEKDLKGKIFVRIENGEITGEASFPTDELPMMKGRYFNGSVSLKASLENGVLIVTLDRAEVNGKPIPEEFMTELRSQNLAKDVYKDAKAAEVLRKFESLTIEDDKIILKPAAKKKEEAIEETNESTPKAEPPPSDTAVPNDAGSPQAEITSGSDLK